MNNRIPKQKNKVNKNQNFIFPSIPDEIISIIENTRFKYKEGLYKVLGYLLYRCAYGYNMRVSQEKIAAYLGLKRETVQRIIKQLKKYGLIFMTYHKKQISPEITILEPSGYAISPALRDPSPKFRSKLCYLYPFLAKVSATFFCFLGALQRRFSKHLSHNKVTLYNKGVNIIKSSFYNVPTKQERSQKGSKNGVENPTHGKDASSIKNLLANFLVPPKIPTPEVRPNMIFYSWSSYCGSTNYIQ